MALPQGIYFRRTDDQTDPTNYDAEVGLSVTPTYPRTTAQGNTVGWEDGGGSTRDRVTTGPVELRGVHFITTGPARFRIDLPATGSYNIRAAFGDAGSAQDPCAAVFTDSTTDFATPVAQGTAIGLAHFIDASGVDRTSAAAWSANNASITHTFASTIFRTKVGYASGFNSPIAALYIESTGGGTTFNQSVLASCSPVASLVRQAGKAVAARTTPAARIARQTGKPLARSSSPRAAVIRATGKKLQANSSPVASLSAIKVVLLVLQATASAAASLVRATGKGVQAATRSAASLIRATAKALQASTRPVASVTKAIGKRLAASASAVASLGTAQNAVARVAKVFTIAARAVFSVAARNTFKVPPQ